MLVLRSIPAFVFKPGSGKALSRTMYNTAVVALLMREVVPFFVQVKRKNISTLFCPCSRAAIRVRVLESYVQTF